MTIKLIEFGLWHSYYSNRIRCNIFDTWHFSCAWGLWTSFMYGNQWWLRVTSVLVVQLVTSYLHIRWLKFVSYLVLSVVLILVADIDGNTFWSHPFNSLCHPKQLEEFIVIECSTVRDLKRSAGAGVISKKVSSIYLLLFICDNTASVLLKILVF